MIWWRHSQSWVVPTFTEHLFWRGLLTIFFFENILKRKECFNAAADMYCWWLKHIALLYFSVFCMLKYSLVGQLTVMILLWKLNMPYFFCNFVNFVEVWTMNITPVTHGAQSRTTHWKSRFLSTFQSQDIQVAVGCIYKDVGFCDNLCFLRPFSNQR